MEHRPLMGMLRAEEIEPQRSPGVDALEDRGEQLLFGGEMHAQLVGEGIDDANQLGMMREELAVAAGEDVRRGLADLDDRLAQLFVLREQHRSTLQMSHGAIRCRKRARGYGANTQLRKVVRRPSRIALQQRR